MKTKIVLLLSFIMLLACNDDENYEKDDLLASQNFKVLDGESRDLLNSELELENSIDVSKIKLYYLINNQKIEVKDYLKNSRPDVILDRPYGFEIKYGEKEGKKDFLLCIDLNTEVTDNDRAYTFIEWNQHGWDTDTIQSEVSRRGSTFESIMVIFNDSVWNRPNTTVPPDEWTVLLHHAFTIIK